MFGLNFNKILQQLQQSQEDFRKIRVGVGRGEGAVELVMNGLQEVVDVRLGPGAENLLAEGTLASLLGEAYNEALRSSRRLLREEIIRITGITNLPEIPGIF